MLFLIRQLRPLGNGAYFAALSSDGVDAPALRALPAIAGLDRIDRAWKLDPRILAGQVPQVAVLS